MSRQRHAPLAEGGQLRRPTHRTFAIYLVAFTVMLAIAATPTWATAATPELLWEAPLDGNQGAGAGQLDQPIGIATNPSSGHIYIADRDNARVAEYDPWGQFVKAWGWGVANGAAELQACGPQAVPPTTSCQAGTQGDGAGQFFEMRGGIAIDEAGDVYVGDLANRRVQKFDAAGNFLLAFGGEVDKGPGHPGNVCTAAYLVDGDTCGAGVAGAGGGSFSASGALGGDRISVGPGNIVSVGDKGRIQSFQSNGLFESQVDLTGELAEKWVSSLDVDTSGNYYVTTASSEGNRADPDVHKMNSTGVTLFIFATSNQRPASLALDDAGSLYVGVEDLSKLPQLHREIIEFAANGAPIIALGDGFAAAEEFSVGGTALVFTGLATNAVTTGTGVDVYSSATDGSTRSVAVAYGPAPDKWPPPPASPEINSQFAVSVDATKAVVSAEINPHFWADTKYYVEYGTGSCSVGNCTARQPLSFDVPLGAGVINRPVATKRLILSGLQSKTTYHYRFVAESAGGGPVYGAGSEEGEGLFITPSAQSPLPDTNCPNQAFRIGLASRLPDCRAYEMVSPIDKNNSDIISLINIDSTFVMLNQSSSDGDKITYTTSQGFGDSQGTPYVSQYIATRTSSGWQNHGITPPQGLSPVMAGKRIDLEFRAFTADLCSAVIQHPTNLLLAPGAAQGFANLYLRNNCGSDTFSAVTTTAPSSFSAFDYLPEPQGLSADGRCVVFYAEDKLTPDANPAVGERSNRQLYESCDEVLRLVSILPSGKANEQGASLGTDNSPSPTGIRTATDAQAVSTDGSTIYWTANGDAPGPLYVRIHADQDQSKVSAGKCAEASKACTIKLANSSASAHFWGASADGSRALFTNVGEGLDGEELFAYDLESRTSTPIASQVVGVMGVGGEATRAYFVSTGSLTGSNVRGEAPTAGKPNLYFYEGTDGGQSFSFIGTLTNQDAYPASTVVLSPINDQPFKKTSRLSPDGRHLAFMSTAPLTGYDNIDKISKKANSEIFVYDAETGQLYCASCNPTGQRPAGRIVPVEGYISPENYSAALLPPYMTELYGSRVISGDGSRVFFDSYEALVPRDTNGMADVYEWQAPNSTGCTESSSTYSSLNGGCLGLISSGESPSDSEFVDASTNGRDVFFATASSLVPQDADLIDIYNARENGGYPPPPSSAAACEGESCQGPLAAPNDPTPASSSFEGAGNVVKESGSRRHRKAKHKVKRQRSKQRKQQRTERGRRLTR